MSRPGGKFFEEFLMETKGAKAIGKLPAGPITTLHPVWAQSVKKSGGYQINVATLG